MLSYLTPPLGCFEDDREVLDPQPPPLWASDALDWRISGDTGWGSHVTCDLAISPTKGKHKVLSYVLAPAAPV